MRRVRQGIWRSRDKCQNPFLAIKRNSSTLSLLSIRTTEIPFRKWDNKRGGGGISKKGRKRPHQILARSALEFADRRRKKGKIQTDLVPRNSLDIIHGSPDKQEGEKEKGERNIPKILSKNHKEKKRIKPRNNFPLDISQVAQILNFSLKIFHPRATTAKFAFTHNCFSRVFAVQFHDYNCSSFSFSIRPLR